MYNKSDESGRTMLETIMYISLLIVLGASIAQYISGAFRRYKIGRTAQQVLDFKKAIVQFTAADEDYTQLSIEHMDAQHAIPLDMRAAPGTARHALGGSVTAGPDTDTEVVGKYMFFITFDHIFQGGCVEILTQGQFYGDGSEMDTLIVNNKFAWRYKHSFHKTTGIPTVHTVMPNSTNMPAANIRLTITDALSACNQREDNTITWIFS